MAKYQFHLHHLMSDKHFYTDPAEVSDDELKEAVEYIKVLSTEVTYFSFEKSDGTKIVIPKEILRNSVIYLEKV